MDQARSEGGAHAAHRPIECPEDYAYVLGLYLGDGHIARLARTFRLCIYMDSRYSQIVREARRALASIMWPNKAAIQARAGVNMMIVRTHSSSLPELFPQHGPGRKHERPIRLAEWQQAIVDEHPDLFVRGLIQSDGCRAINKVWGGKYQYPRYFFTQESVDIMDLFTDACDRLGIEWAFTKRNTVSVAKRASVALLDEFVGPKR
ncbi:MAG TPA: hypothetical protein VGU02_08995 [Gaiellaceae bacterium]|nr:hypothetical protein [Gaiellaceae bacterium]